MKDLYKIFAATFAVIALVTTQFAYAAAEFGWDGDDESVGGRPSGWDGARESTTMTDEINGPFGPGLVAKIQMFAEQKFFGGAVLQRDSGNPIARVGEEVWVRFYFYFDNNYCHNFGNGSDAWGKIKWVRMQDVNGGRYTYQIGGATSIGSGCNQSIEFWGATDEVNGGGGNDLFNQSGDHPMGVGRWHSFEFYTKIDTGSAGVSRAWIDGNLIGENTGIDTASGDLGVVMLGDYYNGNMPQDQHLYVDEIIITTTSPDARDENGFPMIGPDIRAAGYGDRGNAPNPPVILQ